jgi:hypothetical protein
VMVLRSGGAAQQENSETEKKLAHRTRPCS